MIGEFVVRIAMLRAEDATGTRVASRSAVGFHFHAMGQAFRDVPPRFGAYRVGRAGGDAGARRALRAGIEAERFAWRIDLFGQQQRGAKCYPGTIYRMHRDAEDARPGDARDFAELDEAEGAGVVHEGIDGGASQARFADGRREVALDYLAGEVVERIFVTPPSGTARCVRLERDPQCAAAVADDDDRSC